MGRTSSSRREHIISYRVTGEEAARIDMAAARMTPSRSRSDWARAAALWAAKAKVPEPVAPRRRPARRKPGADIELLAKILAALGKVGSNVNQLARVANSTGRSPAADDIQTVAGDVAAIRQMLEGALRGESPHGD